VVETHQAGDRLALDPDAVDAVRFQALAAAGREELRRDPRQAGQTLREALALWRGPALADAATARFAAAAAARLEELHLGAVEDRIDADLAAGGRAAVLAELDELVRRSRPGVTALFRAREGGRSPGASRLGPRRASCRAAGGRARGPRGRAPWPGPRAVGGCG
jgi:Bacterial transcriptional activator domain